MRQIESMLLDITENRPYFILVSCHIQQSPKFWGLEYEYSQYKKGTLAVVREALMYHT